ncbi:MAG TPA: hypothetical protein VNT22_11385 [Baekduia sp.]|nr:hypothetical protein [Baekduia sp.]
MAIKVMKAQDTPSGTRMIWNIKVNAICALAQGTGSTANAAIPPNVAFTFDHNLPVNTVDDSSIVDDEAATRITHDG